MKINLRNSVWVIGLFCSFVGCVRMQAQESLSLAGTWQFRLDKENRGLTENWQNKPFTDLIQLPGTTDEGRYGEKTSGSDFGILTRAYKYYGPAWYAKEIEIPSSWKGKYIQMELERVLWESRVFVDGKVISIEDALSTPHWHNLGYLSPGKHRLAIRINNEQIYNIGDKGHVYSEYTQSIWNGAVGRIRLVAKEPVRFSIPQVYTHTMSTPCRLQVTDTVVNESGRQKKVLIRWKLQERESGQTVFSQTTEQVVQKGKTLLKYEAKMPAGIRLWNDATPILYTLRMTMEERGKVLDTHEMEIGFREVSHSRSKLLVNGKPVFLRGNLDCVHFPLTGYPSCRVEDWEKIFRSYKAYGLNHVRFHSWCPPEAAFIAADRIGIYIQAETIWIDWWMSEEQKERKEMDTQGHPQGLGKNLSADAYVQKELVRMIHAYGNHPSFVMQCIGNELGNSDFEVMESWIKPLRKKDSRRLYAVSTARKITSTDQYIATHYIEGVGSTRGIRGGASTNWDFEDVYSRSEIPVIAHEIGQWPVYPKWDEIKKYTGVLKARNLEEFREQARRNKIEEQNEDFVAASGALNQIMYKYEIESFLRTPSCAGIQLLSMQDYQGQGEALMGWLDVFYDSKGITTPEQFRCHHDSTVPLLRLPKYVWKNNESFTAGIQLAHYGTDSLEDGLYWKIKDETGSLVAHGELPVRVYPVGSSEIAGPISCSLQAVRTARKLQVEVGLQKRAIANSWNIWVYPVEEKIEAGSVYLTDRFDADCISRLERGESVLLDASGLGTEETCDQISFYPLYWSLTFFPGQGKNTIGMVVRDKHPLFSSFPTDAHSDWQWQSIYKGAHAFYINEYPEDYKPVAQPIDDFHRNNKLASIFELKVGKGKLLVCGFNLKDKNNLVARQLTKSMLRYMQSPDFNPSYEPDLVSLQKMFVFAEPLQSTVGDAFEDAFLYMDQGKVETRTNTRVDIKRDGQILAGTDTLWEGKELVLTIQCPSGIIGSLNVCFAGSDRAGTLVFEGRTYSLEKRAGEESWVKLHVMREDSNDGKLVLKMNGKEGTRLVISKVALVGE